MKPILFALLSVTLATLAKADSIPITTVQLSGITSTAEQNGFISVMGSPHPSYDLNLVGDPVGWMEYNHKNIHVYAAVDGTLVGSVFTGTFKGIEWERLGQNDYVYWNVTGTITESVNFAGPTGTGTIQITGETFGGKYVNVTPEPGTWMLLATGLVPVLRRYLRK